jgi:hypothetical protein
MYLCYQNVSQKQSNTSKKLFSKKIIDFLFQSVYKEDILQKSQRFFSKEYCFRKSENKNKDMNTQSSFELLVIFYSTHSEGILDFFEKFLDTYPDKYVYYPDKENGANKFHEALKTKKSNNEIKEYIESFDLDNAITNIQEGFYFSLVFYCYMHYILTEYQILSLVAKSKELIKK